MANPSFGSELRLLAVLPGNSTDDDGDDGGDQDLGHVGPLLIDARHHRGRDHRHPDGSHYGTEDVLKGSE